MLDLIFFVLGMTLSGEGDTSYAEAAPASEEMAAIVEQAMPDESVTEEGVTEATAAPEVSVLEEAVEDVVEEVVAVEEAVAEDVVEKSAAEPESAGGGSWNIESANDSSWITNAPEGMNMLTGSETGGGDSLLAGISLSDDETAPAAQGFQAEPQIATGKFTTATEVKPILEATRGSWVALRDYEGQDWLYVTHIWSWRCGLHQMRLSINGGPMEVWPLPPCHEGTSAPNAIVEGDGIPATTFASGEVQSIQVELLLDDLSTASAQYIRADVLMP